MNRREDTRSPHDRERRDHSDLEDPKNRGCLRALPLCALLPDRLGQWHRLSTLETNAMGPRQRSQLLEPIPPLLKRLPARRNLGPPRSPLMSEESTPLL